MKSRKFLNLWVFLQVTIFKHQTSAQHHCNYLNFVYYSTNFYNFWQTVNFWMTFLCIFIHKNNLTNYANFARYFRLNQIGSVKIDFSSQMFLPAIRSLKSTRKKTMLPSIFKNNALKHNILANIIIVIYIFTIKIKRLHILNNHPS